MGSEMCIRDRERTVRIFRMASDMILEEAMTASSEPLSNLVVNFICREPMKMFKGVKARAIKAVLH